MEDNRAPANAPSTGNRCTSKMKDIGASISDRGAPVHRANWTQASKKLAASGGDLPVLLEISNQMDAEFSW